MKEVIDHYGAGMLGMVSVVAVFGILMSLFGNNGALSVIVSDYMSFLNG